MLILASSSPRRRELLTQMHYDFICRPRNAPELTPLDETDPKKLVIRNAVLKATAAINPDTPDEIILGADTVVAYDNQIFGKPHDDKDAYRMLKILSGKTHQVYTGIAVIKNGHVWHDVSSTDVTMSELSDTEILNYIKSGEPTDKAGAYAIQGLASVFIEKINGSYSNVVGLPLNCLYNLLKKAAIKI